MIQINTPNVITITLCGALGYALLAGIPKLRGMFGTMSSGSSSSNMTSGGAMASS